MLKFEIKKGDIGDVCITGSLNEVLADTITMIHFIYLQLLDSDKEVAKEYKKNIVENIGLAFMQHEELEKESKKKMDTLKKLGAKKSGKVLEKIEELNDILKHDGSIDEVLKAMEKVVDEYNNDDGDDE